MRDENLRLQWKVKRLKAFLVEQGLAIDYLNGIRKVINMSEERFTSFIEDNGYWIRDESDFKIIATGLKLGVALNLRAYLNELNDENKELKLQLEAFKDKLCELGVSDVKLYGKRYYTGLEDWLND